MPRNLLNSIQAEWRIALLYGIFAGLWSLFAEKIVLVVIGQERLEQLHILFDIAFGLISAALIYILVKRSRNAQERGALRELEHLTEFQRFFGGSIEYAMFSLNANGLVRTWDAEAARMHGLTTNQVLNYHVTTCFASQEAWSPERLFKQAQALGRAAHLGWLIRQDGHRYWGEVIFEKIKLSDEHLTYLVITRNLSGSRGNERFKSMIESMTEGLIVIDREWRFAFINSNGAQLLERDPADLIGKNFWLEYPNSLGSEFGLACRQAMDQNISTIIDDIFSSSTRWLENRIYPSPDGILIFYLDVSEKRQAEEAIRISEQRLRMVLLAGQQNFFDIDLRFGTVTTDVYQVAKLGNNANIQKTGIQQVLEDWHNQIHPDDRAHVLEELNAFISGNRADFWVEYRWKMADGSWRWKLSQGAILEHDETSQAVRMLGTQIDIQSFKSIEQALQTSNRRYLKLVEASPVAIFEANSNGETIYVNARWQEITGYNRSLAMNQGWSTTLHPEDRPGVLAAWKEAVDGQKAYAHEYRFQHADGTTRWVYGLAEPLKDQNGNVTGYLGSMVDLTSRKRIELELEAVRKRSIAIVTALPTPIVVLSPEGLVEEWNPAATALFGWSADEVIGRFVPLVSPEDTGSLFNKISLTMNGVGLKGLEVQPLHRDGFKVDALLYTEALPATESNPLSSTVAVYVDMTQNKQDSLKLEQSEKMFRLISENSSDMISLTNLQGVKQYVSPAVNQVLGYSVEEFLTLTPTDWKLEHDPQKSRETQGRLLRGESSIEFDLYRARRKDGAIIWLEVSARAVMNPISNRMDEIQTSARDVTHKIQAQEALKASEQLYRTITENSHDVTLIVGLDSVIEYVSPAVKTVLGFDPEQIKNTRAIDYIHPNDLEAYLKNRQLAIEAGLNTLRSENRTLCKNGSYIWTDSVVKIIRDATDKPKELQITLRDINEQVIAQEKLQTSERLYRTITENTRDVIAVFTLDGKITYISPSIKAILGYEEEFIKSKMTLEFIHPEDIEIFNSSLLNTIKNKNDYYIFEIRALHNNGNYVWVETSGKIIRDSEGVIIEIQSTTRDIQERVVARKKLEKSEYLYRNITENAHDVTLITHTDSNIQYVSPSVKTILGFEPEEIIQTRAFDYFHPDDLEVYVANRRTAIENGKDMLQANARLRHKNGGYIWVELVIKINRNAQGDVTELQVTLHSIDDRKLAQEKLEDSERLYRTITENAQDVTIVSSVNQKVRFVSPSATSVFGYDKSEFDQFFNIDLIHPEDQNTYLKLRQEAIDTHKESFSSIFRALHQNGHYIWVESISKLIRDFDTGTVAEIQSTLRDISERVVALKKLEESERLYRTITENARDVIIITAINGKIRYVSPSATSVFGYNKNEINRVIGLDFIHPEDLNAYLAVRQQAIDNHEEYFNSSFRVRHQNRHYIWVESISKLIRDDNTGALTEIQATVRDISERVVAVKKLEESERLYRTITENAQDVIVVSTADRQLRYVSPSASTVFGYDQNNIAKMLSVESMHPDDQIAYLALRQDALDQHKDRLSTIFRVKHQNGNYIWIETLSKFVYDPETKELREIQATLRDVTSRKTAQEALEQLNIELEQRVEERTKRLFEVNLELESFTSSVSHDLRSPLNVIQGFGRAFLEDYSATTPTEGQDFVNRIVGAAGRMDVLITDLLQYSRLSKAEIRLIPVNLEQMLLDLVDEFEIERERRNAIILVKGNFPSVLARETILRQILINLVGNSLKFSRSNTNPEITIWAELEHHSQMIKIHVQDNGIGIETRDLERIFQPFERLHGISEYPGSGIGLAFVKRGIERMGGQIGVTSTLGKGSHFWLLLNRPREMT